MLCGRSDHELLYPAHSDRELVPADFACTSTSLGDHDDIVRCLTCGLVTSNPSLDTAAITAAYEAVVDEDYLAEEHSRVLFFEWVLDRLAASPAAGRRLFEVGTHIGIFLHLARRRGWQVSGIEPSRWAVNKARESFGLEILQQTLDDFTAAPGSFDVIATFDVLEHLEDPVQALSKLRMLLDDDGTLILTTLNMGLHARVRGGRWAWFIRPHLVYFSRRTLIACLGAAGFEPIEFSKPPRPLRLSHVAHRLARSQRFSARILSAFTRVADPRLPFGWLGDIVFVIARPTDNRGEAIRTSEDGRKQEEDRIQRA